MTTGVRYCKIKLQEGFMSDEGDINEVQAKQLKEKSANNTKVQTMPGMLFYLQKNYLGSISV